jgi:DNA-binding transcriptional MerR regulator
MINLLSIKETAELSGVSIRTLHYYDEIDLLKPAALSDSGYRYYGMEELKILQQILFYRELDFSLKEIKTLVSSSENMRISALEAQKHLLELKRKHIDELIILVEKTIGDSVMKNNEIDFTEFTNEEYKREKEKYVREVKEKWGNTSAYLESEQKNSLRSTADELSLTQRTDEILDAFGKLAKCNPEDSRVQLLVEKWQKFISDNHYKCTNEILSALGDMYVLDERFKTNIDKHGIGTAKLMNNAIKYYVTRK